MLQQLIEDYGYVAVFVGCFLEGETVLVLAGFAAHMGYLSLPGVIGTAALAGFLGDETAYFVGRHCGERLLARFGRLREAQPFVQEKLARYGTVLVFFIRFLIGLRIATPALIGVSRALSPLRFTVPNAAGAVFWASVIGALGYVFGHAFTGVIEHAKRYEEWAFLALGVAIVAALAVGRHVERRRWRRRTHAQS